MLGSTSKNKSRIIIIYYYSNFIVFYRDLTEKGLKKLANSIELSYSTIQKLVVKPLTTSVISLLYHLNTLKGMSNNKYFYAVRFLIFNKLFSFDKLY